MSKSICFYLLSFFLITESGSLMAGSECNEMKVEYYGSFSGYSVPLKPVEKLDKSEALSRKAYYIAHYNSSGDLVVFEKYIDNILFFRHEYSYHKNGKIKKYIGINEDGEKIVYNYDNKGREIKAR